MRSNLREHECAASGGAERLVVSIKLVAEDDTEAKGRAMELMLNAKDDAGLWDWRTERCEVWFA